MILLRRLILVALSLTMTLPAYAAATYYISAGGSDANAGTSKGAAWLRAPGMPNFSGSYTPATGDHFIFRGGDSWHFGNAALSPYSGGTYAESTAGSVGNLAYIGVDKTWFSGGSWVRPIFTGDNPVFNGTTFPSSCAFDFGTPSVKSVITTAAFVQLDNIEVTGVCWSGNLGGGNPGIIQAGANWLLSNMYVHGFTMTATSTDTMGMVASGTSGTSDSNTFDGSDAPHWAIGNVNCALGATAPCTTGITFYDHCSIVTHNVFHYMRLAGVCVDSQIVHDNLFEYSGTAPTSTMENAQHDDALMYFHGNASASGVFMTFYNNVIRHNWSDEQFYTGVSDAQVEYIFNNVFYDNHNATPGNCFNLNAQSSGTQTLDFFNNTIDNDTDASSGLSNGCVISLYGISTGNSFGIAWNGPVNAANNHLIGYANLAALFTTRSSGVVFTLNDLGGNVIQSTATARIQGYTQSQSPLGDAPTFGGATIGVGVNETSLCSTFPPALCSGTSGAASQSGGILTFPAIPVIPRPTVGAWDSGAFQFQSPSQVLYPNGRSSPIRQLNIYNAPLNSAANPTLWSHMTNSAILNSPLITGITWLPPMGCSAGGGCAGTVYFDQGSTSCSSYVPTPSFTAMDASMGVFSAVGKINNMIVSGAGFVNNSSTHPCVISQQWADSLSLDGVTMNPVLTWQPSHPYLPSDYLCIRGSYPACTGGAYWQQTLYASNTDVNDIHCTSGSGGTPAFTTSPQVDGSCSWTLIPLVAGVPHAPPQDTWCDSNTTGNTQFNCFKLTLNGAASIASNKANVTVTSNETLSVGATGTVTGASNTNFNCSGGNTATIAAPLTATTISYTCSAALTNTGATTLTTGTWTSTAGHSLNINTPNATSAIVINQLPVPWELPMKTWRQAIFSALATHYSTSGNPSVGYFRMGLTKAGESDTSNSNSWPVSVGTTAGAHAQTQYLSYENDMLKFQKSAGCGALFACVANLHTYGGPEAAYAYAQNIGFDNNAMGSKQVAQLILVPPGTLPNGGLWNVAFGTYTAPMANGKTTVNTLQTGGTTQSGSPGTCDPTNNDVGSMAFDSTCTTTPFTTGYPGNWPMEYTFLGNNSETYLCDILLMLDPSWPVTGCTNYSQATYQAGMQAGASAFLNPQWVMGTQSALVQFTINFTQSGPPLYLSTSTSTANPGTFSSPVASHSAAGTVYTGTGCGGGTGEDVCWVSGDKFNTFTGVGKPHISIGSPVVSYVISSVDVSGLHLLLTTSAGNQGTSSTGVAYNMYQSCIGDGPGGSGCQNTTWFTSVNPASDPYTRITDGAALVQGQSVGSFTTSGADVSMSISANETYLASQQNGGDFAFFQLGISSGKVQVLNPGLTVIHGTALTPTMFRPFSFDYSNDNVFYGTHANALYQYTISNINTLPSAGTLVVDWVNQCPGIPASAFSPSGAGGTMIPSADSNFFSVFVGPQGTAVWVLAFDKRFGCSAVNFATGQYWAYNASCSPNCSTVPATGTLLTTGTSCWGANVSGGGGGIHDIQAPLSGGYILIGQDALHTWTQGFCAGNTSNDRITVWQAGTANTFYADNENNLTFGGFGSHSSIGFVSAFSPWFGGYTMRPIANVSAGYTTFFTPALSAQDVHWSKFFKPGDVDTFPWVGATDAMLAAAGSIYSPPYPQNLVLGLQTNVLNSSVRVFGPTYSCGPTGTVYAHCTNPPGFDAFGAADSIGVVSPNGHFFCFATSHFLTQGLDNANLPRTDVDCILLQ